MRTTLLLTFALVACGDSGTTTTIDGPPPVTQDCATYCNEITTNCTGANAQYADAAHCMATCTSFPMGTASDTTGNTLGCRIYHAGAPSMMTPATHCIHAGPGGDKTSAAAPGTCGDACTSFCTLDIKVCGSTDAPLTGITPAFQNMGACMTACGTFEKTTAYSSTSTSGNNLACRLYHATNAAVFSAMGNAATTSTHCGHTASPATGQCI